MPPVLGARRQLPQGVRAGRRHAEARPDAARPARCAVPFWITENGVPTGSLSGRAQAAALGELVRAAHAFSATFHITDYRWFNLRDSIPAPPAGPPARSSPSTGLLRADYSAKPAFGVYRGLIARYGTPVPRVRNITARR